jgi:hypothetical protein
MCLSLPEWRYLRRFGRGMTALINPRHPNNGPLSFIRLHSQPSFSRIPALLFTGRQKPVNSLPYHAPCQHGRWEALTQEESL